MQAIRFHYRPVRYLATRALGRGRAALPLSRFGFVSLDEADRPPLPGPDWVRVRSRLAGICGTDLSMITAHESFTLGPFGAYPFTLGHELLGDVVEAGAAAAAWRGGERVAVNPMLACPQRGLPPCPPCERGQWGLCRRTGDGAIGAGYAIGFHPRVGGGWGTEYVAHCSQLHRVDGVPDSEAALVEPYGVVLRAAAQHMPVAGDVVFVIGVGSIGILLIRALRRLGWEGTIAVQGRHGFQLELARAAGADTVVRDTAEALRWAASLPAARAYAPPLAPRFVEGGPSLVFDTVGREASLQQALSVTREGGRIVLLGAASSVKLDWTRVWYRQLSIHGAIAYGTIPTAAGERDNFEVAVEHVRAGALSDLPLITHVFGLPEYREAIATALDKTRYRSTKVVFRPNG